MGYRVVLADGESVASAFRRLRQWYWRGPPSEVIARRSWPGGEYDRPCEERRRKAHRKLRKSRQNLNYYVKDGIEVRSFRELNPCR